MLHIYRHFKVQNQIAKLLNTYNIRKIEFDVRSPNQKGIRSQYWVLGIHLRTDVRPCANRRAPIVSTTSTASTPTVSSRITPLTSSR